MFDLQQQSLEFLSAKIQVIRHYLSQTIKPNLKLTLGVGFSIK
jgi:hypothetical protein